MNRKADDSEAVDRASRAGAPGEPHADGHPADRLAEWDAILGAVRSEKAALSAMNARVVESVMAKLQYVDAPHAEPYAGRLSGVAWRRAGGLALACALVFVGGIVAVQMVGPFEPQPAPTIESAKVRIDSRAGHIRVEVVPDAWSLQQALDVVPAGSRVKMRAVQVRGAFVLERPMTIDSQSGPIVIGRS